MNTSMHRQVLTLKKSLCFQPKPCLLNIYIDSVENGASQESLRGHGRKRKLLVPSVIMDFVEWGEVEEAGLSSAACDPGAPGRLSWGRAQQLVSRSGLACNAPPVPPLQTLAPAQAAQF